jgi:hypothetical protein
MALSYNFEVRHIPLFHILKAKALKIQGSYEDALNVLNSAIQMPGIKDGGQGTTNNITRSLTLFLIWSYFQGQNLSHN